MTFSVLMFTTAAEIFLARTAKVSGAKTPGTALSVASEGEAAMLTLRVRIMAQKIDRGFFIIEKILPLRG